MLRIALGELLKLLRGSKRTHAHTHTPPILPFASLLTCSFSKLLSAPWGAEAAEP